MEFNRQTGILNPSDYKSKVSLVGCGSVGSFTALALSKMGVRVSDIYDNDVIEPHNLPNQFFKLEHVGRGKTEALCELLWSFAKCKPNTHQNVDERTSFESEIVVSAVDSMEARKLVWERVKNSFVEVYIDSRMGGRLFSVHTVNMLDKNSVKGYEKTLTDDDKTLDIPCTERTIIFNVLGVASVICNQVVKVLRKEDLNSEIHFDYGEYGLAVL